MPKHGLKPKDLAKPRYNPYQYQLVGPFLGSSDAFLRTAKGQDLTNDLINDDTVINDVQRRS